MFMNIKSIRYTKRHKVANIYRTVVTSQLIELSRRIPPKPKLRSYFLNRDERASVVMNRKWMLDRHFDQPTRLNSTSFTGIFVRIGDRAMLDENSRF